MLYTYYIPLSTFILEGEELKIACTNYKLSDAGEMRGEAAPYSLVPSEESSLLHEREGDQQGELSIKTGPTPEKKRRSVSNNF